MLPNVLDVLFLSCHVTSSFNSVRGTGAKCLHLFRSVEFIQFSSRTLPALTRIDLVDSARLRLGSVNRVSNWLGGAEEEF